MMLTEVKGYLCQVKTANLAQICQHFKTEPSFMRLLLAQWISKGKVRKAEKLPGCGTKCIKCLPEAIEIYEWIG